MISEPDIRFTCYMDLSRNLPQKQVSGLHDGPRSQVEALAWFPFKSEHRHDYYGQVQHPVRNQDIGPQPRFFDIDKSINDGNKGK